MNTQIIFSYTEYIKSLLVITS